MRARDGSGRVLERQGSQRDGAALTRSVVAHSSDINDRSSFTNNVHLRLVVVNARITIDFLSQMSQDAEGRRARRKVRTRRALLDAALALVADHGLDGTRIEDVTREADLGKGAFYNYFPSKTSLVAALVDEVVDDLLETCHSLAGGTGDVSSRVRQIIRAHDAYFRARPASRQLFHQARGPLPGRSGSEAAVAAAFERYLESLSTLLWPPSGTGAPESADVRRDLAAAVAGAIAGYRSFDVSADRTGSADIIETVLADGIAARLAASAAEKSTTDRGSST